MRSEAPSKNNICIMPISLHMKRALIALTAYIVWSACHVCPAYSAGGLSVNIAVEPEPLYRQLNAGESYIFNISVANDDLTIIPGQPTEENLWIQHTGRLITVVDLRWRASGSYDFGEATSGYVVPLDRLNVTGFFELPDKGSFSWVAYNHTFDRDALDFGIKPFETLEILVLARVYFEVYNYSVGTDAPYRGPLATEASTTYKLLDETKVRYVEGKYLDMSSEVKPLRDIDEVELLNTSRFLGYLIDMNRSIEAGDYFSALKTYSKYDKKYRSQLVASLTEEALLSMEKTSYINQLEQDLDTLNVTYTFLEDRYVSLLRTYQAKQVELEAAKQSLSTAITAVFLASIAFFFLGRRSVRRGPGLGDQTIGREGESRDSEPGVRGGRPRARASRDTGPPVRAAEREEARQKA